MYMIVTRVAQSAPCLLNVANQVPMNVLRTPMESLHMPLDWLDMQRKGFMKPAMQVGFFWSTH